MSQSVTFLIPAHNEEQGIADAVQSVLGQTVQPDRVIVILDNCTDSTKAIAESLGAETFETVGNTAKKAGALNQAWEMLDLPDDEFVFVMDADSDINSTFVETAFEHFAEKPELAAVGGTFLGKDGGGFVGMMQRNEYSRYARDVRRRKGKILVLTGTATMFRVSALRYIESERGKSLPGEGGLYDTKVLTEDNELTLCLLHSKFEILSPMGCGLNTEIMETWGDLAAQRLRWKRGALENLFEFGLTKVTAEYWARQVLSAVGVVITFLYLFSLIGSIILLGSVSVQPIWMAVTGIFIAERIVTVRQRGWKQMALASVLVVEMVYDLFLQLVQARALWQAATGKTKTW